MKRIATWAACTALSAAIPCFAAANTAGTSPNYPPADKAAGGTSMHVDSGIGSNDHSGPVQDAHHQVAQAAKVLRKMKQDPQAAQLLHQAKAVLIMPEYGRAGLIVGGGGGPGVLVARHNGQWNGPALYNVGSVSIGAQAGASGGSIAMLIMSQKALRQFEQTNDFALNADAGITVWNASARGHGRTGGDIAMWSDTKGLYGGATVGATDINFDEHETAALYGKRVEPAQILNGHAGRVTVAQSLLSELPSA